MSNLIATVIFYNDALLLEQSLKSVKESGLDIIAIDGKWSEFPDDKLYSTDGSIDVAKKYADKFIEADKSFLQTQMSKRNRYIQEISDNDYFFVIDSDEKLVGGVVDTNLRETVYGVALSEMDRPQETTSIRVHKKRDNLQYALRHCYLFLGSKMDKQAIAYLQAEYAKVKEDINPELVNQALKGCITRQWSNHFIQNINGEPMKIEHYQDRRSLDRQNKDLIYMSNRLELQLNKFIPEPGKIDYNLEPDTRVVVKYFGDKIHKDAEIGNVVKYQEVETTYQYAIALQRDWSPFAFRIVKVFERKLSGDNKILNDKLDLILRILQNV